jgi:hypothetical protein
MEFGKATVSGDPGGQCRVGALRERHDGRAGDGAVVVDVVAGQHGERGQPAVAAGAQSPGQVTEDAARRSGRVGEIGQGELVVRHEGTGVVVDPVAALGDRERHDAGPGNDEPREHGVGVVRRVQNLDEGADDASVFGAVGFDGQERVEAVLPDQGVANCCVAGQDPDAADAPGEIAGLDDPVEVHGLVGAVEGADPEVDDADLHGAAVVAGDGETGWRSAERGGVEGAHGCRPGKEVGAGALPSASRQVQHADL